MTERAACCNLFPATALTNNKQSKAQLYGAEISVIFIRKLLNG